MSSTDSPQDGAQQVAVSKSQLSAEERREAFKRQRREAIEKAPYVSLSLQTSGIHPSTSRIVTIDMVTLTAENQVVDTFHAVLRSRTDPGPFHAHGVPAEDFATAKRFGQILKAIDRFLDGRTLIVHNTHRTWGFIAHEAKLAMNEAARRNRSNSRRGAQGQQRRRYRVGHVPRPKRIVDVLASARRQAIKLDDVRLRGLARTIGIDAPSPVASTARALQPYTDLTREDTLLLGEIFFRLEKSGPLAVATPEQLRADKFGLQRSHIRVEAHENAAELPNPGTWQPGSPLVEGMEVVVSPEIAMDPDDIIRPLLEKKLVYSEKLTRQTSVVVCNQFSELDGKAMHAQRKGIPLMSDVDFMKALETVVPATHTMPKQ